MKLLRILRHERARCGIAVRPLSWSEPPNTLRLLPLMVARAVSAFVEIDQAPRSMPRSEVSRSLSGPSHTPQISSRSNSSPSTSSLPSSRLTFSSRFPLPRWPPRQISAARSWGSRSQPRRAPLAW